MKKLAKLLMTTVVFLSMLSACKKEYTCVCTTTYNPDAAGNVKPSTQTEKTISAATRGDAEVECGISPAITPNFTIGCHIK